MWKRWLLSERRGREESRFLNVFQKPTLDSIRKRGTSVAKRRRLRGTDALQAMA